MEDAQFVRWVSLGIATYIIVGGSLFFVVFMEKIEIIIKLLDKINNRAQSMPTDPTLKSLNDIYAAGRR